MWLLAHFIVIDNNNHCNWSLTKDHRTDKERRKKKFHKFLVTLMLINAFFRFHIWLFYFLSLSLFLYPVDLSSSCLDLINWIYACFRSNVQQSVAGPQVYNESKNWSQGKASHFFVTFLFFVKRWTCQVDQQLNLVILLSTAFPFSISRRYILFLFILLFTEKSWALEIVHYGIGPVSSRFGYTFNMANSRSTRTSPRDISTRRSDTCKRRR